MPSKSHQIVLTEANIKDSLLPLPVDKRMFPVSAIGGPNKSELAASEINVLFEGGVWVKSDIDGKKKVLRNRSAVRKFYAKINAKKGYCLDVERLGLKTYLVKSSALK
jgi:hypothetical protein